GRPFDADRVAADVLPDLADGRAIARVSEDETAFGGRNAAFTYNIGATTATAEGFDEEREWVRSFGPRSSRGTRPYTSTFSAKKARSASARLMARRSTTA